MRKALFLAIALPLLAAPAVGQALKGHDTNTPVSWSADRIEVQDRAGRVVLTGNVVAQQSELTLNAPRVTVAYTNSNGVDINRIDASGGVLIRRPGETARGEFAIYDFDGKAITIVGNVSLVRGASNVSGARLTIDLVSGRAVIDGRASSAGDSSLGTGRVSGTFTVRQKPK